MSDEDPDYRPSKKVSGLFERNQTRSYRSPRDSESDDANFATAANLDSLLSGIRVTGNDDNVDQDNMGEPHEAIRQMQEAFEAVALQTRNNDMKNLTELPYFGTPSDTDAKKWITDSCTELISHVEKATAGDTWNDQGRIRVLRSRLLGPALEYINEFSGVTMEEAKTYLLKMFHDPTTYASVSAEIEKCKRRNGEQIPFLAIRISKLYSRLKRVSTNDLTPEWIEKSKKELLLKLLPGAVRNFVKVDDDTYDVLLKGILDYLETNTQHKLTRADIENERERQIKQINMIHEKNNKNPPDTSNKNTNKTQTEQNNTKTENDVTIAAVTGSTETPNIPNQNGNNGNNHFYRGRGRGRNYGGRGRGRGNFHGGFRGRGRGRGRGYFRYDRRDNRNFGYNNNNQGYRDHSQYQCYACKQYGHIARFCDKGATSVNESGNANSTQQGNNNNKPREKGPITCWSCQGLNHIAKDCRNKNF